MYNIHTNNLYLTTKGEGDTPALFLHGLWGGGNYFRHFDFPKLPFSPLYFPDQLGFGKSPKPNIEYTPKAHIDAIRKVLPKNQKYTVIANSFGTALALYYAHLYPKEIKRLILVSPLIYKDLDEAKKYLSTKLIARITIELPLLGNIICKSICKTRILSLVAPFFVKNHKRVYIQGCTEHTWHTYYSTFMNGFLREELFPTAKKVVNYIPTFIIYGKNDNYISPETIKRLNGEKLKLVEVKNSTHDLIFEQFDYCLDIIANWLSNQKL